MTFAPPQSVIDGVLAEVFAERESLTVSAWAAKHRRLTARSGARPGPWDNQVTPYAVEIMDAWCDPSVSRIVQMAAAQMAKTEALMNCALYSIDNDACPIMYVTGNVELARAFNQDRFTPTLDETPRLDRHRTGRKWDEKAQSIRFLHSDFYLVGANSATNLASRPIGRLLCDEIDKWPESLKTKGKTEGRALELARARTASFGADAREIVASTPTDEGVGIHAEFLRSDQRLYHCPCVHCGRYQPVSTDAFDRVHWDVPPHLPQDDRTGKNLDDEALADLVEHVRRTAWLECRHCAGRLESMHKPEMLRAGLWVARGQAVEGVYDRKLKTTGVVVGDPPATSVRGYHCHGLMSPFRTFGDVAAGFVALRGQPDRAWVNNTLGEPWREIGERAEHHDIIRLAKQHNPHAPSYEKGTVPRTIGGKLSPRCPLVLTGFVDVQIDRVYLEVAGWGEQETCCVIDWDIVECPEVGELADSLEDEPPIAEVLGQAWARVLERMLIAYPVENPLGAEAAPPMPVRFWGIDSGFRTREVYEFARRANAIAQQRGLPADWVIPAKGFDTSMLTQQRLTTVTQDRQKRTLPFPVALLEFDANGAKDDAYRRLRLSMPAPQATCFPRDLHHEYARQLTSEQRVLDKRRKRMVWQIRPGRSENHWWDCRVGNLVRAQQRGLRDLRAPTGASGTPGTAPRARKSIRLQPG